MKLDNLQKDEFVSYWGRCPLILNKELVAVESLEKISKDKYKIAYYRYFVDPTRFETDGNVRIATEVKIAHTFDDFEPYFLDSGFYQINSQRAAWISRRPERSRRKGMHAENTDLVGVRHITDKTKEIVTYKDEFSLKIISRIFYGRQIKHPSDDLTLDEFVARSNVTYGNNLGVGYSVALSKNVALVSSSHDIPIVFYKMNPVGYYLDSKILLQRKKIVSTEVIKEETGLPIEIYEG